MNSAAYMQWFSKLCRPRGSHLSSAEYLRALEILRREFSPFVVGGLSTLDEVLVDIDWDKSPGWPYVNQGCSTKRQAWEKFRDLIVERAESLMSGQYVECIFIASLKDELLPPGKNARIFLPAPFHHQLACAMLFKKAVDSLTATCHKHSSAVGVNIFGQGLERCLRSLEHLPFAYDADQSGCDTSWKDAEPERDFMKTGLPPQMCAGVDLVFNLAMCPRVIVGDRIVQVEMNPSGWYLTTTVNTLMTHRVVASAYLDLSPSGETIDEMRKHLAQVNGGDDLAYSTDREWFGITQLAQHVAVRGMYLETDCLQPRNAMKLTFFSHRLFPRLIDSTGLVVYAAGGRLSKILSSFSFLKLSDGKIDWQRNASRVVGLMINLWPYKAEYDILYPYLYHMVHHFFLLDGQNLSSEWSGVFRSIPNDQMMLMLRNGHAHESSFLFSRPCTFGSFNQVKRVFQSALKSDSQHLHFGIDSMKNSNKKEKQLLADNTKLHKELKDLKNLVNERRPEPKETPMSRIAEASHETAQAKPRPKKKSLGSRVLSGVAKAGKFLLDNGVETLLSIGASLLESDHIQVQLAIHNEARRKRGLDDLPAGTIPMGTILGHVAIYPNFAADIDGPDTVTRLQRKASTFLRYKFQETTIQFTPAAGALNNGQIGFFIASDPRYTITATGEDAIRLVHEFKGVVTQVSQMAKLPVPKKDDWLFVEDNHESDVRFTQQGVLWIVAYTDLQLGDGTGGTSTSLGAFSMDYNIAMKDDSIEGASVTPAITSSAAIYAKADLTSSAYLVGDSAQLGLFAPVQDYTVKGGVCYVNEVFNNINIARTKHIIPSVGSDAGVCGLFTFKTSGVYKITVNLNFTANNGSAYIKVCKLLCNINGLDISGGLTMVVPNPNGSQVCGVNQFYRYCTINDYMWFMVNCDDGNTAPANFVDMGSSSVTFELAASSTGNQSTDLLMNYYKKGAVLPPRVPEFVPKPKQVEQVQNMQRRGSGNF